MIKLIVLDVDGCMTNGYITFDENGVESKSFNVKDGLGIATWLKMGMDAAIITGRESKIVQRRAKELGITHLYQGIKNKLKVLEQLLLSLEITPDEIAVIGDDINDVGMLRLAKMSFAPANATEIAKESASYILSKNGGEGAVREMIERIVEANGQEKEFQSIWI